MTLRRRRRTSIRLLETECDGICRTIGVMFHVVVSVVWSRRRRVCSRLRWSGRCALIEERAHQVRRCLQALGWYGPPGCAGVGEYVFNRVGWCDESSIETQVRKQTCLWKNALGQVKQSVAASRSQSLSRLCRRHLDQGILVDNSLHLPTTRGF